MSDLKGKTFKNPVNRDEVTFIEMASENNSEKTILDAVLFPGGGTPLHYHKTFDETFEVLQGELMVQAGKQKIKLTAGEKITAKKGVHHRFYSESDQPTTFRTTVTPGHEGFEKFLPILYGLARDGLVDKGSNPKNFRHTAIIMTMSDTRLIGPLSILGWIFGFVANTDKSKQVREALIEKYCQ
ncbi:MAG: cupin domain-containing protein [Deinococcota bacterium]